MITETDQERKAARAGIAGALWGALIGDALGATWEFSLPGDVPDGPLEITGGGPFGWDPGEATDDGQQILALCAAYREHVETGLPVALCFERRLLLWFLAGPRDVGYTTSKALRHRLDIAPTAIPADVWDSRSNGGIMRSIPIGLAHRHGQPLHRVVREITSLTHPNPDATGCVYEYVWDVDQLLTGSVPGSVLLLHSPPDASSGYRDGSDEWALHCARWATHRVVVDAVPPRRALEDVIRLGGDTDTNACVAGGMIGASAALSGSGSRFWPRSWLDAVDDAQNNAADVSRSVRVLGDLRFGIAGADL